MKKNLWSVIVFLTAIFTLATFKFWLINNPIKVSFISNAEKDIQYQIFYSDKQYKTFTDERSVKKDVERGKQNVEMLIFAERIDRLKLVINNYIGKVYISDLNAHGWRSVKITEKLQTDCGYDISHVKMKDNNLDIISAKKSPEITYKLKVKAPQTPDFYLLTIFLTFSFLLAYKIVQYLSRFKILENNSRIDIVFLSCFFVLLFIPMSHISQETTSQRENRSLASYPRSFTHKGINTKFGEEFENWYNDRFYGRRLFIKIDEWLKGLFVQGNKDVLVGSDDWLFYKHDNSLNNYANKNILSETQLQHGLKYLTDIDQWCKKHHKKFYYLLIPDKNKVYGEHIKNIQKLRPDTDGIGWQFVNYIKKNSDVNVIYLYDVLHNNKDKGLLFWKNDTHWNHFGAYIGYLDVMKNLGLNPIHVMAWQNIPYKAGDLSNMYPQTSQKYENLEYKEPLIDRKAKCNNKEISNRPLIDCKNSQKKLRLLTMRDSFSSNLESYYAETFAHTKMIWDYTFSQNILKDIEKNYDIVILENVERYIPKILELTFPED